MASNLKYAVAAKNARLNILTTQIGTSGLLAIYTGAQQTTHQMSEYRLELGESTGLQ